MDVREFPVLTEADRELIDVFAIGLGDDAARVLAYLQRRREDDEFSDTSTETAVHVGTNVSKSAAKRSLTELTSAAIIEETTVQTTDPGRPPKAWRAVSTRDETARRLYAHHAKRLLEQSKRVEARLPETRAADGTGGDDSDDEADRLARPDLVSIGLNWQPNGLHLPLFAARASDDSRSSVEFAFREYTGSRRVIDGVESGESDVGIAGAATVVRERERGRPIVPIAVLFQRSTVVLFTTREQFGGSFDSLECLRGRRVGMPTGTETGLLGRLLLEQAGIREAVEVVDVEGEERDALESGSVDVVTGMGPDPHRVESSTRTVEVLTMTDQFPVYGPVVIANESTLETRPTMLEGVLAAIVDGWASAVEDPEPAAADIAADSDESADRIVNTFERAREAFGTSDAVRKHGWGWHAPKPWSNLRAALAEGGAFDESRGGTQNGVSNDD
ncbi:ABC transporter substrate-binding protein [Halostagnicola sp. A-GB9-2]|uniref:ABC transporter substrate-binding protein n=1 Tax=Halostagnicola sp. A-GB9-2 TaxID=3048066 RepID=UPI0024BF4E29|nr:ABC transporter substrate-binding protein [Halostagnicola sp. A-GB9-2]MDJ1434152.1 ABC transporter substrate-binding protein [Halostagnicola sp. A-GB9-2]